MTASDLEALDRPAAAPHVHRTARAFDVIIVGGGSAGAVLARRLTERADRRVLLLEAGRAYRPWAYPPAIASSDSVGAMTGADWGYRSEPGFIGRPIGAFRGKVLGGSSAINGAVAIRARPQDFRNWGLPGWSYEDLLPAFRKLDEAVSDDPELHGRAGPFPTRQMTRDEITPMQDAFVDAVLANGLRFVADFDGAEVDGVGFVLALTRPRSAGRLWIESLDPLAPPRIDPAFLADPIDRARLMEGA